MGHLKCATKIVRTSRGFIDLGKHLQEAKSSKISKTNLSQAIALYKIAENQLGEGSCSNVKSANNNIDSAFGLLQAGYSKRIKQLKNRKVWLKPLATLLSVGGDIMTIIGSGGLAWKLIATRAIFVHFATQTVKFLSIPTAGKALTATVIKTLPALPASGAFKTGFDLLTARMGSAITGRKVQIDMKRSFRSGLMAPLFFSVSAHFFANKIRLALANGILAATDTSITSQKPFFMINNGLFAFGLSFIWPYKPGMLLISKHSQRGFYRIDTYIGPKAAYGRHHIYPKELLGHFKMIGQQKKGFVNVSLWGKKQIGPQAGSKDVAKLNYNGMRAPIGFPSAFITGTGAGKNEKFQNIISR